jgi:ElaB/YqjD/DUF883 family membrane-anchored ribosome-binding protein
MNKQTDTWDEVRQIADELELKIHLASMDARDRWQALRPRLVQLEETLARSGKTAGKVVKRELSTVGAALRKLRDDVAAPHS